MSGFGERFRRVGYDVPKPLILVDDRPMVEHVVNMFPGEIDFIFICNAEHLVTKRFEMRDVIRRICPTGQIVPIEPHKLGPVHAVEQVLDMLDDGEQVIVNYCDFSCYWDWAEFKEFVTATDCDGAIPAYRGFHPHSLGSTNYAYLQEKSGWITGIREKQPFTDDKMSEFASSGTYYFKSGALLRDAVDAVIERDLSTNGEFYVSLAYIPLIEQGRHIAVYPLQHFMQWGTPDDLQEYQYWDSVFAERAKGYQRGIAPGVTVVPMGGLGERFSRGGYSLPKPLIEVAGKPMAIAALEDLPRSDRVVCVIREDMPQADELKTVLLDDPGIDAITSVQSATCGQACTAAVGTEFANHAFGLGDVPVTFGVCDSGFLYDTDVLGAMLADETVDVIAWGVRGYFAGLRNPKAYGWLTLEGDAVTAVQVKEEPNDVARSAVFVGVVTFRRMSDFERCLDELLSAETTVNGEYYLDSCLKLAVESELNCQAFMVDAYVSWGTPDELRTFEYWQSCFSKWPYHPYGLNSDPRVPIAARDGLAKAFAAPPVQRPLPGPH
jgi:NDP-sugar pyrophosphorylase family protein